MPAPVGSGGLGRKMDPLELASEPAPCYARRGEIERSPHPTNLRQLAQNSMPGFFFLEKTLPTHGRIEKHNCLCILEGPLDSS
jgi:hypothetical protein